MPEPQYGEPWKWDEHFIEMISTDKEIVWGARDSAKPTPEQADRIVACVNFCRYLSDEQIRGVSIRLPILKADAPPETRVPVAVLWEET